MKITGSLQDTEEGANDVMLRVWGKIGTYNVDSGGSMGAWVAAITRNIAIDIMRKQSRRRDALLTKEVGEYLQINALNDRVVWGKVPRSPLDEALREEDVDALMRAVSRLSRQETRYSEVTRLYLEGLTTTEVAEQMGLCESTAKVQYFRAKAKLRTLMGVAG